MIDQEVVLRTVGRIGLGLLTLFVLVALSIIPFKVAGLGDVRPAFILMAVYYWSILRASPLVPIIAFLIGILLDLIAAWPLGMHAMVFVAAQWITAGQRRFLLGQPFPVIWAVFGLIAIGASALQWAVFSLLSLSFVPVKLLLVSTALSICLFPAVVVPLSIVHKALSDDRADGA